MQIEEKWYIENGEIYNTEKIFSKILENRIDKDLYCWNETNKSELISKRFNVLNNRYGLLEYLGEGTSGTVYLGFDISAKLGKKRLVAIKQPTNKLLHDYAKIMGYKADLRIPANRAAAIQWAKLELGQKFSQEALLMGRLSTCENVVSIIDHDVRVPYIVLEYCDGSLQDRIKSDYTGEDIENWAKQIAKTLDAAHSLKPDMLIHRDLKPENILIANEILKISDFGTSMMKQQSESLNSLRGGYTPRYAAPEAFSGRAYPQTDIWSLGIILYEIITKEIPFKGNTIVELAQNIMSAEPENIENIAKYQVSSRLKHLIMKSLEKEAENRPNAGDYLKEEVIIVDKNDVMEEECNLILSIDEIEKQKTSEMDLEELKSSKTVKETNSAFNTISLYDCEIQREIKREIKREIQKESSKK